MIAFLKKCFGTNDAKRLRVHSLLPLPLNDIPV